MLALTRCLPGLGQPQNTARHCDRHGVSPIISAQLLQDVFQVHSDRFAGDAKLLRDLLVSVAPRH